MRYFGATVFSGLIFLVAAFVEGALPVSSSTVSQETLSLDLYRETLNVKQGVSQDGMFVITKTQTAPLASRRTKMMNHSRTLRAFFASDRNGVLTLYVESVKPHEYYSLTGGFIVSDDYPVLAWESTTILTFYGTSPEGQFMKYAADVHLNLLSFQPVDSSVVPAAKSPSGDFLP